MPTGRILQRTRSQFRGANTLDSYEGATNTRVTQDWAIARADANADLYSLQELRDRSRDLYKNAPIASGAINKVCTSVIGDGLRLKSAINRAQLGLTEQRAVEIEEEIEMRFEAWASNPRKCDFTEEHNFYKLQRTAFLTKLQTGDSFALLPIRKRQNIQSQLSIRLVDSDRIETPYSFSEDERIFLGIERQSGRVLAYYVLNRHPYSVLLQRDGSDFDSYRRVPKFGPRSGRRLVVHCYDPERPEQSRGVPFLSTVIIALKQLTKYSNAELTAAVINAYIVGSIQEGSTSPGAIAGANDQESSDPEILNMSEGLLFRSNDESKIDITSTPRPNPNFDIFFTSMLKQIGSSLEIPFEVLLNAFNSSYSAARASIEEAWKKFRMLRKMFATDFCQCIYSEWLYEEVFSNRIDLPGFLDDEMARASYESSNWYGPAQTHIDPLKEAKAAEVRLKNNLTTRTKETREGSGESFKKNAEIIKKEKELLSDQQELPPVMGQERLNEQENE